MAPATAPTPATKAIAKAIADVGTFQLIPIEQLVASPTNPRKHFDDARLEELAQSIREKGLIEAIVVRPKGGKFEIVAGERRWRACRLAGVALVKAEIRQSLSDTDVLELQVIENLQREDLAPLEEARGYQALSAADRHYTPAVMAAKVGKSESYVYRRLKLLELEAPLQAALAEDRLSIAHAEKLMRLPAKLRAEAAHPTNGVVWRHSPLLSYSEKWVPSRDDLRPLSELEHFIRQRSAFDPVDEDTRHFQPELAEQLGITGGDAITDDNEKAVAAAMASVVELTEDPMARMRMRAGKRDQVPLTPSKWREVKTEKQRCEHTVRGVITHGGPPRVLDVCVTKRCAKHFPPPKVKPKASTKTKAAPAGKPSWQIENEKRDDQRRRWSALFVAVAPALVDHLKDVRFSAALVREAIDTWNLKRIRERFGVELTEASAAQVLALSTIDTHDRGDFLRSVKPYKFNLGAVEQKVKADAKKTAPAKTATKVAKKTAKKVKKR